MLQQEKAKAVLGWLTNQKDRKLLILRFGLEGETSHTRGALAALNRSTGSQIAVRLNELLDLNLYVHERAYIEQRERAWQVYPYAPLGEGEFLRALFAFYGPQREIDPRQFALSKISWESLEQRIEQGVDGQMASEESSRCSLKEQDFLFQEVANPELPIFIREMIAQLWPHMNLLERGITILGFGLAGRREYDPKEIARMLMHGQPVDLDKVHGLLRRVQTEAHQHSREIKKWA